MAAGGGGNFGGGISGESGIDLNFDFIDFDFIDEAFAVFDHRSNDAAMFYELKSKTVPPLDET